MPFLRDEGPPVSPSTIQEARASLAPEYGYKVVRENNRSVLLVRSPRAKPDYLHELEEVALYVTLDEVKDVRDVLLIGTEKVCRLEPLLLRDHIRSRTNEDRAAAETLLRQLPREYGYTMYKHPEQANRLSIALRIPKGAVAEITPDDVKFIRARLAEVPRDTLLGATAAYLVADSNFERLGRRVFFELVDPELAKSAPPPSVAPPELVPGRSATPTLVAKGFGAPAASFVPSGGSGGSSPPSLFTPPAATPPPTSIFSPPPPATAQQAPAAARTKPPKELVSSDDNVEVYVRKPTASPAPSPPVAAAPVAPQDNGAKIEPVVRQAPPPPPAAPPEPEDPVSALDRDLHTLGYESVAGVSVLGTHFDLAAHHGDGKRLLVKHIGRLVPEEVKGFEKICRSVGADACVLVVDEVTPAMRLATWGTPVEVMTPEELPGLLR